MKVCYAQLEDAREFAEQTLNISFPRGTTTWIASRFDDGTLAGVAVFTQPDRGNSSLHVAAKSPRWFTPTFCRQMFEHAFHGLEVNRLTATVQADNIACIRLALKTGFKLEGKLTGFTFGALFIFGLLRGDCKWVL